MGLSLGGAIAALLAGQEPRVKTTVLWNAVASTREMSEKLSAGPYGGLVLGEALLESMRAADPAATIRQATGPVLIIAATGDTVVLPAAEAYAASLAARTLCWFEGGDHTFHPDWRRTLFAWTITGSASAR